jgi:hypothetical protein
MSSASALFAAPEITACEASAKDARAKHLQWMLHALELASGAI